MLRKVYFFDKKNVAITDPSTNQFLANMTTCSPSPDGSLWVGTSDGRLGRLDVAFNLIWSVQAFTAGHPVIALRSSKQAIVTLGQMADDGSARLCAYHLYRTEMPGQPLLVGSVRIPPELGGLCVDVTGDFQFLAIGCKNGSTLIYNGSTFGKQGIKPRILLPEDPVTILAVRFDNSSLFIVTKNEVTSVRVSENSLQVLNAEPLGSPVEAGELVTFSYSQKCLLVTDAKAVYGYTADQGNVSAISVLDQNAEEIMLIDSWSSYFLLFHNSAKQQMITITASFGQNRFVASQVALGEFPVLSIAVGAWDGHSVIVFSQKPNGDVQIMTLREKSLNDQLSLLTQKCLFDLALEVANANGVPKETLSELYRQFGDFHFEKAEFERAVAVYSKTIDLGLPLETSHVINKFLLDSEGGHRNPERVKFVADYLDQLHHGDPSKVTKDHTILLILCYQSMHEEAKLASLIHTVTESALLDIVQDTPSLIDLFSESDLLRVFAASPAQGKRLFETLISNQSCSQFVTLIKKIDPKLLKNLMHQSSSINAAVVQSFIDGEAEYSKLDSNSLKTHLDFCNNKSVPSAASVNTESASDNYLSVLLEITLRTKGNSKELVRHMINRGQAAKALTLCKMFGAPASTILPIAAALNAPFDALAYPAMSLSDVCTTIPASNQNMEINALAVQKRSGVKNSDLTLADKNYVSLLLEMADAGTQFGSIKGAVLSEFRVLEECIEEQSARAENDSSEVLRMKNELNMLKRKPQIHQFGKPCALCKTPLTDLPVVLFKCMHGYHQHCAGPQGSAEECRICLQESQHHKNILNQRKESVTKHDEMFKAMAGSKGNRFDVAIAYLGHGLFTH